MVSRSGLLIILWGFCLSVPSLAQDQTPEHLPEKTQKQTQQKIQEQPRKIIIENEPSAHEFFRVAAEQTPSKLPVPRYVSLKFNAVNGRQGPSLSHPVLWQYQRKGLPLIVVAETENWRKVRDNQNEESWVRRVALSGSRSVITRRELEIRTHPRSDARMSAVSAANVLMQLGDCNQADWCRVTCEEGFKGWVQRRDLWGAQKL